MVEPPIEAQARDVTPKPRRSNVKTAVALIWAVLLAGVLTGAGIQLLQSGDLIGYAGVFSAIVIGCLAVWTLKKP